jgi:hypothetical protein
MRIARFNESKETFKNTDDDIQLLFADYTEDNLGTLEITNALILDGEVIKLTPYVKDTKKVRKCKVIKLNIKSGDGLELPQGTCYNNLEILENLIQDIKKFYAVSGEEVNYMIDTDYSGMNITFIALGEFLDEGDSKSNEIDVLLGELRDFIKTQGKRPSLKGNWLEVRGKIDSISNSFRNIGRGNWDINNALYDQSKYVRFYIDWYNKVREAGYTVKTSTNDRQFIIQLF